MGEIFLGKSETGCKLIKMIRDEIELMYTMKSPQNSDRWASDKYPWFQNVRNFLYADGMKSDGNVMYLTAEYAVCSFQHDYVEDKGFSIPEAYIRAARAGSPYARLWCVYCMEKGMYDFPEDSTASREMLEGIEEMPKFLVPSELTFMKEEFFYLVDEAYHADEREDEIGTDPSIPKEDRESLLPDPTWYTLHLRYIQLARFMVELGLPYVTHTYGYDYRWDNDSFNSHGDYVLTRKDSLLFWCREHGINIEMMDENL